MTYYLLFRTPILQITGSKLLCPRPFEECWKGIKFYTGLSVHWCVLKIASGPELQNPLEYIHETLQIAKSYQEDVSWTRKTTLATLVFELPPTPLASVCACIMCVLKQIVSRLYPLNLMAYIHESSQIAKACWDDVSRTRELWLLCFLNYPLCLKSI